MMQYATFTVTKKEKQKYTFAFLYINIHGKDKQKSNRNDYLLRGEQEGGNEGRSKNSECQIL